MIQAIIGALLGGGLLAFVEFLIRRHDTRNDKLDDIFDALDDLKVTIQNIRNENDERYAISGRIRILRFEDELQEGKKHSKDSFDQVMSDISAYNKYCDDHPNFKNDQTVMTVKHIKDVYVERLEKHDWFIPKGKGENN